MPKSTKKKQAKHTTQRRAASFAAPARPQPAAPIDVQIFALITAGDPDSLKKAIELSLQTTFIDQKRIRLNMWAMMMVQDAIADKWKWVVDYTGQEEEKEPVSELLKDLQERKSSALF